MKTKQILRLCAMIVAIGSMSLLSSCEKENTTEDEDTEVTDPETPLPDPEGTITANIAANSSISIGNFGSIGWKSPDNFDLNGYYGAMVSICNLGPMKGLGNIAKIPADGFTTPSSGNSTVACETGYGYVIRYQDNGYAPKYVRLYVVESIVSTAGGIMGAKIKYEYPFEPTQLSISKDSLTFTAAGGVQTLTVTTDVADLLYAVYYYDSLEDWITGVGYKDNTLSVSVAENETAVKREGFILIRANEKEQYIEVAQLGVDAVLSVTPEQLTCEDTASNHVITVTSNMPWTATVNDEATWCTLSDSTGSGNGTFTVNVAGNPIELARSATVTVAAGTAKKTIVVTQKEGEVILSIAPEQLTCEANASNHAVAVTSNTDWSAAVSDGATWCTLNNSTGNGNGTFTVRVAENPLVLARSATVTINTEGKKSKTIVVTQKESGANPFVTANQTPIATSVNGGSYTVTVTSNIEWTAVVDNAPWCTLDRSSGIGNGTITVTIAANAPDVLRTTTVTIGTSFIEETVPVTQIAKVTAPANARTANVWAVGAAENLQIWSDAINIPACNKTTFDGSKADCRNNRPDYDYLYSWRYVIEKADTLCPDGWRVPTVDDFITLSGGLGGSGNAAKYVSPVYWGGIYSGYCGSSGSLSNQGAHYWSSSSYGNTYYAYCLYFYNTVVNPGYYGNYNYDDYNNHKFNGLSVRCVRNN